MRRAAVVIALALAPLLGTATNDAQYVLLDARHGTALSIPGPTTSLPYSPSNPATGQRVSSDGPPSSCTAWPCSFARTDYVYVSQLGTGPTMSFTFQYVGTKYVRLTVTDALGQTASTDQTVEVGAPLAPNPTPTPRPTPTPAPAASFT